MDIEDEEDGGFRIAIHCDDDDDEPVALRVKYTPNYPEELPEMEIEGLEDDDRSELMSQLVSLVRLSLPQC